VAERRFRWLLGQRGYRFYAENELDDVITVREGKRPDFFVEAGANGLLAEVKVLVAPGPLDREGNRVFSLSVEALLLPLARKVAKASGQLAPYADDAFARAIVIDNWRQVGVDLDPYILGQLFDTTEPKQPASLSSHERPARPVTDPARREFISAFIVNEPLRRDFDDRFVEERPMRARVIHNPRASQPLRETVFDGPQDLHFFFRSRRWRSSAPESS